MRKKTLKNAIGNLFKFHYKEYSIELIKKDIELINKAEEPRDDIDRCYLQYEFIRNHSRKIQWIITQVYSLAKIPFVLWSFRRKKSRSADNFPDGLVVITAIDYQKEFLPKELIVQYGLPKSVIESGDSKKLGILSDDEIKIIKNLFQRHPASWKLLLHAIEGLGLYKYIKGEYHPKAIATFACEDSSALSLLTDFCDKNKITHINCMHGEKLFGYTQSFMRINEYYIWDNRYKYMYEKCHVNSLKWVEFIPDKFKRIKRDKSIENGKIIKCYLTAENKNQLLKLKQYLDKLKGLKYECIIRWHPRASVVKDVRDVFANEYEIENPMDIDIISSLSKATVIISSYSTVLLQAKYADIPIVLNDISETKTIELLRYLNFWAFDEAIAELSEINENEDIIRTRCDKISKTRVSH